MKYQITNMNDNPIIEMLNNIFIPVYRVTKDSRIPAIIKKGINETRILTPSTEPRIKESFLE